MAEVLGAIVLLGILIVGVPAFFVFWYSDGKELRFKEVQRWEWVVLILVCWFFIAFVW